MTKYRIKTEEEAKVVASVWGEEFIQLLAALMYCFAQDDFNYRIKCTRMVERKDEFILFFKSSKSKYVASAARN